MDIFSHILWVYVPFRNKLWRDEALLFAALPDIGTALIFGYVFFGTPIHVGFWEAMTTMPSFFFDIYYATHSFVTLGIVALIVWRLRPRLLPALSGWAIHIAMDMPFHSGSFGTRFLYPISDVYISGITWVDVRVLGPSYLALLLVYAYSLRRERKKHIKRHIDIIDKFHHLIDGLIKRKPIPLSDAEEQHIQGASVGLSGENAPSTGQGEAITAAALPPQNSS